VELEEDEPEPDTFGRFECKVCEDAFTEPKLLAEHIRMRHRGSVA
jgi:hypothetical protein